MSGDQVGMNGDEGGRGVGGANKKRIFRGDLLTTKDLQTGMVPNSEVCPHKRTLKSSFLKDKSGEVGSGEDPWSASITVCQRLIYTA